MRPKKSILKDREKARLDKKKNDEELLELHRKAIKALNDPDRKDFVVHKALGQVDKWEKKKLCSPTYIKSWREILSEENPASRERMICDSPEGVALRQNTPFGFLKDKGVSA